MVKMSSLMFLLVSLLLLSGVSSRNITIENKCDYTVWPAVRSIAPNEGSISTTGFTLKKGETRVMTVPSVWIGHFWGRSFCSISSTGKFSCATGNCDSGKIECSGDGLPPVTRAAFNINEGLDSYDIDLLDGYNLPLAVVPQSQACTSISCVFNLNKTCPTELQVKENSGKGEPIGCRTACTAGPCVSIYTEIYRNECPLAFGTFNCSSKPNYIITFCPPTITSKTGSSKAEPPFPSQTKNGILEPPSEPPSEPPFPSQTKNGILEPPSGSSQPFKETNTNTKHKSSWKLKLILGVSAGLTVVIIIVVMIIMKTKDARTSDWNDQNIESVVMLKRYSYKSVKKMTNSFAHVLGKGGFGTVYKGKLPDNGQDVAVKILKETGDNGEEFINEVASMTRTSHVNIVSLRGFCYERNKRAIIYDFMPNGSLDKFIIENMPTKMEWKKLYDIALGVARGLEYLHNRCVSKIVHFDIKPQNILMDEDLCPKISDFGLAKLCKNQESIKSMLDARGTPGYIAPEVIYKNYGRASHKSDVYSYGMVVLEMIGARNIEKVENAISNNNSSSVYFPDWIYKDFEQEDINMRIFGDQISEEEEKIAKKMVLVGLWCIQMNPSDRPTMIKVIEMLEGNIEDLEVPPKPLLYRPERTIQEDSNETSSFSNPIQFDRRGTLSTSEDNSKNVVQQIVVELSQHERESLKTCQDLEI